MLNKLDFQQLTPEQETPLFEIVIDVLDSQGIPTGKKKSFSSDHANKIYSFWFRHRGHGKKRHKDRAATKVEGEKIVEKMYKDEIKQQGSESESINDNSN